MHVGLMSKVLFSEYVKKENQARLMWLNFVCLYSGSTCPHLCSASRDPLSSDGPGGFRSHVGSLDLVASGSSDPGGNNHLAALESYELQTSTNNKNRSNGGRLEKNQEGRGLLFI